MLTPAYIAPYDGGNKRTFWIVSYQAVTPSEGQERRDLTTARGNNKT